MFLTGDSLNSSLVAIISVDPDTLKNWASGEGIKVVYLMLVFDILVMQSCC